MATTRRRTRSGRGLLLAAVVLGLAACMAGVEGAPHGWWKDRGPVVPHDTFPADCGLCHTGGDWNTIRDDFRFDHAAETGYPLVGAHAAAQCLRCHNDRGPAGLYAQRGCAGCHEDVHFGQLGQDCAACHGQEDWSVRTEIELHRRTRFPLVGAHASAACWRCHTGALSGNFAPVDPNCATCHQDDLLRAQNPDHAAQGWVDRCDRCHIPTSWAGDGFNHATWPLTGVHATADCSLCHVGGVFAGTPTECVDCHLPEYQAAANPDHVLLGFPTNCEACHTTNGWIPGFFDHTGVVDGCVVCHQPDYDATTNPDHAQAGFPTSCETCHVPAAWIPAPGWNHSFPIAGKHKNLGCADCHLDPTNYLSFSCTHCHGQTAMADEHDDVSGYVWDSAACLQCHPNGKESAFGAPGPNGPRRPGRITPRRRPGGAPVDPTGGGSGGGIDLTPWGRLPE